MATLRGLTEAERDICIETLARVSRDPAIMRAEQHIINVAMGCWTATDIYDYRRQHGRLAEACAAYHRLLEGRKERAS